MSTSEPRRPQDPPGAPGGPAGQTGPAGRTGPGADPGTVQPSGATSTSTSSASPDGAFPAPYGPRTTGAGGHVLGVLIGLVLTAVALLVLLLGQSRVVADGIGGETLTVDALGIVLVAIGAALAALVALLAVRTSAIPFTGGLLALLVGGAYLFAPVASQRETIRLLATAQNRDAVLNAVGVATTGTPFVLGLVLLATGTAASLVRRRGIEVGTFRARTGGGTPPRRPGDRS
ncbi:hypothetical protein [Cellulomonas aerilata]|uniref:Uncharacterized protein n=1 Tax=Cellulomonas aerilata TaxID=515326 RepID=A0A512DET5_9CELL|nr:hypothetical protein [Cellulomonas aerilata]GEO34987.1 hypothetical protein CAE01nite_27120 [Cellulomonas aerilata]